MIGFKLLVNGLKVDREYNPKNTNLGEVALMIFELEKMKKELLNIKFKYDYAVYDKGDKK